MHPVKSDAGTFIKPEDCEPLMEMHGNKTIMCSVLFLDIVEYSKKSVGGQISLKERFNSYLSVAISSVPIADRIILDTGDGAAINFLGDVEDALKVALMLRVSIQNEDPSLDPPLLLRMGINHGPVRLVRDINSQPNIVGDGINVAQRVIGFAEVGQILVSRSYYDAVSRVSSKYIGMFHYQGSRTDKHVREHEVYAVGHQGESMTGMVVINEPAQAEAIFPVQISASARTAWDRAVYKLDGSIERFRQADPRQRAIYIIGAAAVPVALIGMLVMKLSPPGETPPLSNADRMLAASGIQPVSAVAGAVSAMPNAERKMTGTGKTQNNDRSKAGKTAEEKSDTKKSADSKKSVNQLTNQVVPPVDAHIILRCQEGTQLFVDGAGKGKVVSTGLTVPVAPGKHKIIVTSKSGSLYTQNVEIEPGRTVEIKPVFCE